MTLISDNIFFIQHSKDDHTRTKSNSYPKSCSCYTKQILHSKKTAIQNLMTATQNMYLHSTNCYAKKMIEFEPWLYSTIYVGIFQGLVFLGHAVNHGWIPRQISSCFET